MLWQQFNMFCIICSTDYVHVQGQNLKSYSVLFSEKEFTCDLFFLEQNKISNSELAKLWGLVVDVKVTYITQKVLKCCNNITTPFPGYPEGYVFIHTTPPIPHPPTYTHIYCTYSSQITSSCHTLPYPSQLFPVLLPPHSPSVHLLFPIAILPNSSGPISTLPTSSPSVSLSMGTLWFFS